MVRIENDCVCCDDPTCAGCHLPSTKHYYCDRCGTECDQTGKVTNRLVELDGLFEGQLCFDCMIQELRGQGLKDVE